MAERPEADHRVLVLMPTAQDAVRTCTLRAEEGLASVACAGLDELRREVTAGAGAVLLTEEAVAGEGSRRLAAWSDLPVVVLSLQSADGKQASLRESASSTSTPASH